MMRRYHIIVPADHVVRINDTMQALGAGPRAVSVPLGPDADADPPTHYGASGVFPPDRVLSDGLTIAEHFALAAEAYPGAIYDDTGTSWAALIAAHGLTGITGGDA